MEGFKKDFYTTSVEKKGKPEANLKQSSFTQPQPFSQQFQQSGIQQNYEEWKKIQKNTHVLTPMSEEKPKKQAKSALHQEVSEFNLSEQMSMDQLIKVVLNLQEEFKKQRKDNEKLMQQLSLSKRIESRLCFRKESQAPFEAYHKVRIDNPKISFRKKLNWITDLEKQKSNCQLLRKSKAKLELYKCKFKPEKSKNNKQNNQKSKRNSSAVEAFDIFIGSVGNSNRNKETIGQKNNKRKKRHKSEKNICNPIVQYIKLRWNHIKQMEEKAKFPILLKLDDPYIYIQQQSA